MSTNLRIPAHLYLHLSHHDIFYCRVILCQRWGGLREQVSWKIRDQWEALIRVRDFAIAADKSFVYACEDIKEKPRGPRGFDPNDPSSWPIGKDAHKFEKTIETVMSDGSGDRVHYKVDPHSPEKTYQMKFDTFINWYGDTYIQDVTPQDISEYKNCRSGQQRLRWH